MAKPAQVQRMRDWALAAFGAAKAKSAGDLLFLPADPPFSFTYGGEPSSKLLPTWIRSVESKEEEGRTRITSRWTDPKTGLGVTADVTLFKDYPAVDWVLYFENTGSKDTPIIENVNAVDLGLATPTPPNRPCSTDCRR